MNDFGSFFRQLRSSKNITTRKLSQITGVSQGYISAFETGRRGIPSPSILQKLAKGLDVPYEQLHESAWGDTLSSIDKEKRNIQIMRTCELALAELCKMSNRISELSMQIRSILENEVSK